MTLKKRKRVSEDEVENWCGETMESQAIPDHTHNCIGHSGDEDHFCGSCMRWWGKAS